ncbi:MAG: LPS export ABC transporter permease LptG [Rhizobiaceae bacterium]|nr:LPS export ABC transporter permease LptG [Rhizobiaceae bacterium]
MIGRTLSSYFFRRYLATFGQFFVGICLIAYLVDFTEFSRVKSSLPEFTVQAALLISALRVPIIMQTAVPFIVLFAAIASLLALNRRYELVVARSAGVSAWQFLAPICVASLMIGLLAILVFNPLAARALSFSQELESAFGGASPSRFGREQIPWLRQRLDDGSMIVGARKTAQNGLMLTGAMFMKIDNAGSIVERVDAQRAELSDGKWHMETVVRYRPGEGTRKFDTYEIESTLRPEFLEERMAFPETVPIYELPRKMQVAWSFGLSGREYAMHFHSMVALPILLVAMTLIAATVSMRFVRMGQSASMILGGVVAGFLLYVMTVLAKSFGTAGFVPPVVAAWAPVIVAMFFGVTFLLYREDG